MAEPPKKARTPPEKIPGKTDSPPDTMNWVDWLVSILNRFNRYGWDILGVALLALALLVCIGLLGFTGGFFISPLVQLLKRWLGWGSVLLVVALGAAGIYTIRGKVTRPLPHSFLRIMGGEGLFFSLLALASLLGGHVLIRADAGNDAGGLVGWGMVELGLQVVGRLWTPVILAVCLVIFLAVVLNLPTQFGAWLKQQAQAGAPEVTGQAQPEDTAGQPVLSNPASPPQTAGKQKIQLPQQYRKSLKIEPLQEKAPAAPVQRDDRLPPLNLLIGDQIIRPDERQINLMAGLIEKTLDDFGIPAKVVGFRVGPKVTQYAIEPGYTEKPGPDGAIQRQKVRVSQISALARDLTLALSVERLRIEAPVPGRSYVGIEVPNIRSADVRLRSILESEALQRVNSNLAMALGRDVSGQPVVADLARMPHLLIAGTTGSGKSVCIEAITTCLIMNNTPEDLQLVMIDPKMVELVRFNGVPHLLGKVETDLERVLAVLKWALSEMDHRYRLLENARARDIDSYNRKMQRHHQPTLPRIVILIDELADLMMSAPDQTERSIVRLAQLARATGMHLILATQRPSTDVVTGLIKANFPARISFTVASSVDSRVILDTNGAETLLGRGDMLFLSPESGIPLRAQGVYVTDQELERIIAFWQKMSPVETAKKSPWEEMMDQEEQNGDALIERAIEVVRGEKHASTSLLQRRLHVGYPRAARLIDELEELGVVGPSQGGGREREVLVSDDGDDEGAGEE